MVNEVIDIGLEISGGHKFLLMSGFIGIIFTISFAIGGNLKIAVVSGIFTFVSFFFFVSSDSRMHDENYILASNWIENGEAKDLCVEKINDVLDGRSLESSFYEDNIEGYDELIKVRNSIENEMKIPVKDSKVYAYNEKYPEKEFVPGFIYDTESRTGVFDCTTQDFSNDIPGLNETIELMN